MLRNITPVTASPTVTLLLTMLAVARVTILIVDDRITQPARSWIVRHRAQPEHGEDWLVYLISCYWCTSIWVGAAAATVVHFWGGTWPVQIGLVAATSSLVAGFIGQAKGRI